MPDPREYQGPAIVLSRTNYGEADRVIHFLTPQGVLAVMGRGVRREKSKLRGGCEPFALNEISVRTSDKLGTLKSARAAHLYEKIIYNYAAMEVAAAIIKLLQKATRDYQDPHFFSILQQSLDALEREAEPSAVLLWAELQIAETSGTQLNLQTDAQGERLAAEREYTYSAHEGAFVEGAGYGAGQIKLLRLALVTELAVFLRVEQLAAYLPKCLEYARAVLQQ